MVQISLRGSIYSLDDYQWALDQVGVCVSGWMDSERVTQIGLEDGWPGRWTASEWYRSDLRTGGWVAGWLGGRVAGWPGGRGRVAGCPGGRVAGWPGGRVAGWPGGWTAGEQSKSELGVASAPWASFSGLLTRWVAGCLDCQRERQVGLRGQVDVWPGGWTVSELYRSDFGGKWRGVYIASV